MVEENPYLSQKQIAQILSLCPDIVKRLIIEELNLRRVKIKWLLHTLTARQKLEMVKISRKLIAQRNKLQVNDLVGVITRNETSVSFENSRSGVWAGFDIRRPTRPK
jgi:hypothetical protein